MENHLQFSNTGDKRTYLTDKICQQRLTYKERGTIISASGPIPINIDKTRELLSPGSFRIHTLNNCVC